MTKKEHGITFPAWAIKGLLDNGITMTHRLIRPQPSEGIVYVNAAPGWAQPYVEDASAYGPPIACPYGQPGDRLWVRETWHKLDVLGFEKVFSQRYATISQDFTQAIFYAADGETGFRRYPAIHMPRWASRIMLEIESVRVERLLDVSDTDIRKAGYPGPSIINGWAGPYDWLKAFLKGADGNSYVWHIAFRRLDQGRGP